MKIVFHQVVTYHICEEDSEQEYRPNFANSQSDRLILRDNFDSEVLADIWHKESKGVEVGENCGEIDYGKAAVFCTNSTSRLLISLPLDLTSSSVLQFTIGSGNCAPVEESIHVSFYIPDLESWKIIKTVESTAQSSVHVLDIPTWAKKVGVKLKFSQDEMQSNFSTSCWALDNILILGSEQTPKFLYETMDPIDLSQWLFMPGAQIKSHCMSHGNVMVFTSMPQDDSSRYALSSDVDLSSIALHKTRVGEPDIRLSTNFV